MQTYDEVMMRDRASDRAAVKLTWMPVRLPDKKYCGGYRVAMEGRVGEHVDERRYFVSHYTPSGGKFWRTELQPQPPVTTCRECGAVQLVHLGDADTEAEAKEFCEEEERRAQEREQMQKQEIPF